MTTPNVEDLVARLQARETALGDPLDVPGLPVGNYLATVTAIGPGGRKRRARAWRSAI